MQRRKPSYLLPLALIASACILVSVYLANDGRNNATTVLAGGDGSHRVETELKSSLEQITSQLSNGDRTTLGALVDAVVARDTSHSLQTRVKHVVQQARKAPESGSDLLRWVDSAGGNKQDSQEPPASQAIFWPRASHSPKAECGDHCLDTLGQRIEASLTSKNHGESSSGIGSAMQVTSFSFPCILGLENNSCFTYATKSYTHTHTHTHTHTYTHTHTHSLEHP